MSGNVAPHLKAAGKAFGYFLRVRNSRYFSWNGAYPQLMCLECEHIRQVVICSFTLKFHGRFCDEEGSHVTSTSTERTATANEKRQEAQRLHHCRVHVAHETHSHPHCSITLRRQLHQHVVRESQSMIWLPTSL